MANTTSVDSLADAIMEQLLDYAELATEDVKTAVKNAGKTVKSEIEANAPRKTGTYAKSWAIKTTEETSNSLEVTVYSKTRYQIAHLLENGHAKRGGGRVAAIPHIADAEETALEALEQEIERSLSNG